MNELVDLIKKNAQLVVDQLGRLSDVNFGLNRESVAWVEGLIVRHRARPDFDSTIVNNLVNTIGSFLGECIIANAGGSWRWSDENETWSVAFSDNSHALPFVKVSKLFANGLEGGESILSFYDVTVGYLSRAKLNRGEAVLLRAERLDEIPTPTEADSNLLDPHSAPTLILDLPQQQD
jgi:hypothetical protein